MPATTVRNLEAWYPCHPGVLARFTPDENQKTTLTRSCPTCGQDWSVRRQRGRVFRGARVDTLTWTKE